MHCIFTGKDVTNSDEHVIPRWLQTRFKLANETLILPNGTTLRYKHHRVPADRDANARFGDIEDRISRGILDPVEVYLWAFKLHLGCIYRDASLRWDIKDPKSPFILDASDFGQEAWLFRQLFDLWSIGGRTDPAPFGSVFIVDTLEPTPSFDFIHCLITGAVGINIGSKFILVFLHDGGVAAAHANLLDIWHRHHTPFVQSMAGSPDFSSHCYMAYHVWACESAYGAYRHCRSSLSLIRTPDQLVAVPPILRPPALPFQEAEYRAICRSFGLELQTFNGEINNVYRPANLGKNSA